jgi:hypothetical protein
MPATGLNDNNVSEDGDVGIRKMQGTSGWFSKKHSKVDFSPIDLIVNDDATITAGSPA